MLAGFQIGSALKLGNCHCGDAGMVGGVYGMMIGAPIGALLGVWLAGR